MSDDRRIPDDPRVFIQRCVRERRILWTYHVNMRMQGRYISREIILESVDTYEILESYPQDKYLPSYLVWASHAGQIFHVVYAVDVNDNNVRVVTAYRPDPERWDAQGKRRRP